MDKSIIIAILSTLIASSGFWALITRIIDKKSASTRMILGIGHDRLVYLGMKYIEAGRITHGEYENLYKYLYEPYKKLGGNGMVERLMNEVNKLPVVPDTYEHVIASGGNQNGIKG